MNLTYSSQLSDMTDLNHSSQLPNPKVQQIVFDSVLRYFRFVCQKCKKGFKSNNPSSLPLTLSLSLEILTNEVGTSIIQLEDTLNLPESIPSNHSNTIQTTIVSVLIVRVLHAICLKPRTSFQLTIWRLWIRVMGI